ncbi:UNVERIFIED_CONTAM: putative transcription factor, partial [Sesamum indicum]
PPSSSDEEESGSESESDSDEPDPNIKPVASKPMENEQKSNDGARKFRSKPIASDLVTPAKSTAAKRPAEEKETETKDAKKSKKKAEPDTCEKKSTDDSKKLLFQRLWSDDDEIVILKGMIDYVTKKKSDQVTDLNAFHDFIKKNLHVDVTRTQLQDKIRRLRKKYENNKSKEKEGKDRTFSKPH